MEWLDHVVALFLSFGGSLLLSIGLPWCYLPNNARHSYFSLSISSPKCYFMIYLVLVLESYQPHQTRQYELLPSLEKVCQVCMSIFHDILVKANLILV